MNESGVWTTNHDQEKKIIVTHVNVRQSIIFLFTKLIALDVLATVIALVFFSPLIVPLSITIKTQIISYNILYFGLLLFAKILLTLFVVLEWLNEYYEITPAKIFHRRGIIWRKEDVYDLSGNKPDRITSIGIQQGFLGKIFNYGTLFFYDRGLYKYYYLHYIHNPLRYFEILQHLLPDAAIEKNIIREHVRDKEVANK
ncbi:MAG: PH domain-containing protein [bacterium]|nr:PH domain-containing protein [bacterium]